VRPSGSTSYVQGFAALARLSTFLLNPVTRPIAGIAQSYINLFRYRALRVNER